MKASDCLNKKQTFIFSFLFKCYKNLCLCRRSLQWRKCWMSREERSRRDAGWRSWTDRERRRLNAGDERNCCRARYSRELKQDTYSRYKVETKQERFCNSHLMVNYVLLYFMLKSWLSVFLFMSLFFNVSLQTEDHELWAAHFDSLQIRPPVQNAAPSAPPPPRVPSNGSERGEWEPSSSLSLVWEAMSSCGAESVGGASVDTTSGYPTRAR